LSSGKGREGEACGVKKGGVGKGFSVAEAGVRPGGGQAWAGGSEHRCQAQLRKERTSQTIELAIFGYTAPGGWLHSATTRQAHSYVWLQIGKRRTSHTIELAMFGSTAPG
jgi:hypothetical protein